MFEVLHFSLLLIGWSRSPTSLSDIIPSPFCFGIYQFYQPYQSLEGSRKVENPRLRKGLDALTSSLNQIGDTIGNALEVKYSISNFCKLIWKDLNKCQLFCPCQSYSRTSGLLQGEKQIWLYLYLCSDHKAIFFSC